MRHEAPLAAFAMALCSVQTERAVRAMPIVPCSVSSQALTSHGSTM